MAKPHGFVNYWVEGLDMMTESDISDARRTRFEHGFEILSSINAVDAPKVIDFLSDISPELGHQVVTWAFGDVNRPD